MPWTQHLHIQLRYPPVFLHVARLSDAVITPVAMIALREDALKN